MRSHWSTGLDDRFWGTAALYAKLVYDAAVPLFVGRRDWSKFDRYNRAPFLSLGFYRGDDYHVYIKEMADMSRSKAGAKNELSRNSKSSGTGDFAWCNVELDDGAVAKALELCSDPATVAADFVGLVSAGLDITLKATKPDEFMAACFGLQPNGQKVGLSCYGGTPSECVAGLLVKWYDILDGAWPTSVTPSTARRLR